MKFYLKIGKFLKIIKISYQILNSINIIYPHSTFNYTSIILETPHKKFSHHDLNHIPQKYE